MRPKKDFLEAFDTLSLRLEQASGMITALMSIYTQQRIDEMHHILTPGPMLDALSGVNELVGQAKEARDVLLHCHFEPGSEKANA